MSKRCPHALRTTHYDDLDCEPPLVRIFRCGAWLPLGPANDTPDVLVEVRAAELAAAWQPIGGMRGSITDEESDGWRGLDAEQTPAYLAGWLAYHILAGHDDEQNPRPFKPTEPTP